MKTTLMAILAILVGCAAPPTAMVQPHSNGTAARIDLKRAVAGSPFALVLAQYAVDIATLQRAARDPSFAHVHRQIEASATDIVRRLKTSSAYVSGLRTQALQALPSNPIAAEEGFSSNGSVGAFEQAAQSRVTRAVALRGAQLREQEATVAYDFERAHAGRRLVLGLKLRDLRLDGVTRRRYQAQLDAMGRQESALVDAERIRDDGLLATYAAELHAHAVADSASMASDLAQHARAMRAIPQPQMRALPSSLIHPADSRAATLAEFETARHDLTRRFLELRAMGDAANGDVANEISNLEREREALRSQIVAAIEMRAARIAAAQHLGPVYTSGAPSDASDLTEAVVRSYWVSTTP